MSSPVSLQEQLIWKEKEEFRRRAHALMVCPCTLGPQRQNQLPLSASQALPLSHAPSKDLILNSSCERQKPQELKETSAVSISVFTSVSWGK